MRYIDLRINAASEISEAVQTALIDAGFTQMQIEDASDALDILENQALYKYDYLKDEIIDIARHGNGVVGITLYFTDDEEGRTDLQRAKNVIDDLKRELAGNGDKEAEDITLSMNEELTGDDSEWLYKWQEHFKPTKVGERIVVKPGWEDYEAAEGELVIEMEPGMAFGSGLHETTSMCIKALEKYLGGPAENGYDPARYPLMVLDVGTGTGILAMAAVLLGADDALGIDIDDEAVRVAAENIEKNGLADKIQIQKGDLMAGIDYRPDIIVANLMADLVMMLSPAAAAQIRPGGIYITSGILDIKEEVVKQAVKDAGFDIIEVLADGEWRAIVAERR